MVWRTDSSTLNYFPKYTYFGGELSETRTFEVRDVLNVILEIAYIRVVQFHEIIKLLTGLR